MIQLQKKNQLNKLIHVQIKDKIVYLYNQE